MTPGRKFPPRKQNRRENVNETIRAREVRAVFPNGETEIMPTAAALRKAQEMGLDLVLIAPTAVPPVAKAIDYGHYQYEQKKKQHEAKKKQHVEQGKELKFRPNTDDHDYEFKKNHAIRFLKEGNRVKAVVQFRGREIAHSELGKQLLVRFAEDLAQYEEEWATLIYGAKRGKGFIVLSGEVGTGKSTLLECLRNFLAAQQVEFAYIFNSRLTVEQFFDMMAYDFDLRCDRGSKTEILFALNEYLIQRAHAGRTTALIIDEAQNLDWEVLEEIRLLGNLETPRGKLLQIILAGQPELDRKLDAPDYRQLKQRVALRCTLYPFQEPGTFEYIHSRLAKARMV